MPKDLILDFSEYDPARVVADLAEIRKYNRQRFEMEQLSGICYENPERRIAVGFKDLALDEFWVRGHLPGTPILPGVVMCEIAAQLCSYAAQKYDLLGPGNTLGLGGLNDVRLRGVVRPGQRVVIVVEMIKVRRGVIVSSRFQSFVEQSLVAEGEILGVVLPADSEIKSG